MSSTPQYVRVFLSSPGDVEAERQIVRGVLDELQSDPLLPVGTEIKVIAWEDPRSRTLMPVTITPQEAIDRGLPRPSECDIVVVIFWGRMGTPLDTEKHGTKINGEPYWSGTEWEYLDALRGLEENGTGKPIIYVYRRIEKPPVPDADDLEALQEYVLQRQRIQKFFEPFRDTVTKAFRGNIHEYSSIDSFKDQFDIDAKLLIREALRLGANPPSDSLPAKVASLIKGAVQNWKTFGLLLDQETLDYIDQNREALKTLSADALKLIYLSSKQNKKPSFPYWAGRLSEHSDALHAIQDRLMSEISDQFSYDRLTEFELICSTDLIAKIAGEIAATEAPLRVERLLDAVENVLLKSAKLGIDTSPLEKALFVKLQKSPSTPIARALGWINSQTTLKQALDAVANRHLNVAEVEDYAFFFQTLAYVTDPDVENYLRKLTPPGFGYVPSGWFEMGGEDGNDKLVFRHEVFVPSFWLAITPVTEVEYKIYIDAISGEKNDKRSMNRAEHYSTTGTDILNYPVSYVSWLQAVGYSEWLCKNTGLPIGLPTEAMWEKAASWHPIEKRKLRFPWGDVADPSRCNTVENIYHKITPVGMFSPQGDSPYGMQDMVGNVWEWTSSNWFQYPYHPRDGREDTQRSRYGRVMRGASCDAKCGFKNGCTTRTVYEETYRFDNSGFRVAILIGK